MDHVKSTRDSNGDRRRSKGDRRSTVSGTVPYMLERNAILQAEGEVMRFPWSSPSAPTSPASPVHPNTGASPGPATRHRRTISGNILSKINFLRSSGEDDKISTVERKSTAKGKEPSQTSPTKSFFSRKSVDDDVPAELPTSPGGDREREGALSLAMKQVKGRKRKGSLRKTALLGGRRIMSEARDRKGSFTLLQKPPFMKQVDETAVLEQIDNALDDGPETDAGPTSRNETSIPLNMRRKISYSGSVASTNSGGSLPEPPAATAARLSLLTSQIQSQSGGIRTMVNELGSPTDVKSPESAASYASNTSDDDLPTFSHPSKSYPSQSNITPLSTSTGSYFPLQPRRSPSSKLSSPLSRSLPISAYPDTKPPSAQPANYSYNETETWGWVILAVTWITFTVGMGSCLEIWSWAWDVGETPYAPPELEDDESLPIVGYYPALIVLTGGVVSWVWITVAWVGMKYFRHAKIEV